MNIPLRRYWNLLVAHLENQKGQFALLAALLLSSIGLQIGIPQIMRYFIDAVTSDVPASRLTLAAAVFIALAIFQQAVAISATYVGENVAWTATNELRAELGAHCLHLDMSYHNNTSPGELIQRIDTDISELSKFFSQMVIRVLGNLLLLAGIILVLFLEDWRIGIAFLVFSVLIVYTLNKTRGIAVPHQKALREAETELVGFLEERLAGTEDIRSNGAVDYVIHGLYKLQTVLLKRWRKASRMNLIVRTVTAVMMTLGYGVAFVGGYYLFQDGLITLGTAYLIVHYTNLLARPVRELTQQVESLQNIGASVERVSELRAIHSTVLDGPGGALPSGSLSLQFDNVSFSYNGDDHVLRDLNFGVEPGRVLGLLGRTGSGKTTISRLIFRLYDPKAGVIRLGTTDLRALKVHDLRKRVSMVTQEVQLFRATVRDNLTFFNREIPDERILEVIEDLELSSWYQSLPNGLDTILETGGRGLSAGEAQLLAFARVFLHDPGLVILDEASSRLDPATEKLIERAIDKLLRNRSAIVIAHRLDTVQRADDILILEDGQIAEYGNRLALLQDPTSRFSTLLQTGLAEVLA